MPEPPTNPPLNPENGGRGKAPEAGEANPQGGTEEAPEAEGANQGAETGTTPGAEEVNQGAETGTTPEADEANPEDGTEEAPKAEEADLKKKKDKLFRLKEELADLKEKYESLYKSLVRKQSTEERIRGSKEIKKFKKISMLRKLNKQISNLLIEINKIENQILNKKAEFSDVLDELINEYEQIIEDLQRALDKEKSPEPENKESGKKGKADRDPSDKDPQAKEEKPKSEQEENEGEKPKDIFALYLEKIHRLKEINREIRRITWARRSGVVWAAINMHLAGFLGNFFLPVFGYFLGARWILRREMNKRLKYQERLNSLAVEAASIISELGPIQRKVEEALRQNPENEFDIAKIEYLRGPVDESKKYLRKILNRAEGRHRRYERPVRRGNNNGRRGSRGPAGRRPGGNRPSGRTRERFTMEREIGER